MKIEAMKYTVVVVIPAYRVENEIASVLKMIPEWVRWIVVVNDCSPDSTNRVVQTVMDTDPRILLINHETNQGVGGAMRTGYRKALELNADIVVKLDGDGQMSPQDISMLITPLIYGQADVTKGNRFRNFNELKKMPFIRRLGNMGLSFLSKVATGYWNSFDPTNGFIAMRGEILNLIPLEQLHNRYFFEISQLAQFYLAGAYVFDVSLPARYAEENSSLSVSRALFEFPPLLFWAFLRRIWLRHFIFDFSMFGIYLLTGLPLLFFGLIFGVDQWARYSALGVAAPTGTVIIPTLALISGLQILLATINIDMQSVPSRPITFPLD